MPDARTVVCDGTSGAGCGFPHTEPPAGASLCLCYPKWYVVVPSVIWAAGVGFSLLYLGVHYPSDVLAGALIGTASAVLVYNLSKSWWQDSPQPVTAFAIPVVVSF